MQEKCFSKICDKILIRRFSQFFRVYLLTRNIVTGYTEKFCDKRSFFGLDLSYRKSLKLQPTILRMIKHSIHGFVVPI